MKEPLDLLALQEPRLGGGGAFDRDGGHLLGDLERLGAPTCQKLEEGAEDREPVVSCAAVIVPPFFEVL